MGPPRRPVGTLALMAIVVASSLVHATVAAAPMRAAVPMGRGDPFANIEMPPSLGQAQVQVFVPETGHTLQGVMLDYWRATGSASGFGYPISEPYIVDGLYSQAFENGVFQFWAGEVFTERPFVRLAPLGRTALASRGSGLHADGRRSGGGGDRRADVWLPQQQQVIAVASPVTVYVEQTGHTIAADVLSWYQAHEGEYYLGPPISEPLTERGVTIQWFEGGAIRVDANGVALLPLGRDLADEVGADTAPVARGNLPSFDEALFWRTDSPFRLGPSDASGPKRIEVNLTAQRLWAYQGDSIIFETPISSGKEPNDTETGFFRVRYKKMVEDMRGATDEKGEVVWVASDGGEPPLNSIPYGVADVPHVLYINLDAEALHGTYWHDNFGVRMSHGCINLPLDFAEVLYGWAPLGTPVWVHD